MPNKHTSFIINPLIIPKTVLTNMKIYWSIVNRTYYIYDLQKHTSFFFTTLECHNALTKMLSNHGITSNDG